MIRHYCLFQLHVSEFQETIRTNQPLKINQKKLGNFLWLVLSHVQSPPRKSHKDLDVIYFFILFSISDFFNFLEQEF